MQKWLKNIKMSLKYLQKLKSEKMKNSNAWLWIFFLPWKTCQNDGFILWTCVMLFLTTQSASCTSQNQFFCQIWSYSLFQQIKGFIKQVFLELFLNFWNNSKHSFTSHDIKKTFNMTSNGIIFITVQNIWKGLVKLRNAKYEISKKG